MIEFCGGARAATGSQHLIEVDGQRILLECGPYQDKHAEAYERNRNFLFDAMVLSYAHINHSGKAANSLFCANLHLREQCG